MRSRRAGWEGDQVLCCNHRLCCDDLGGVSLKLGVCSTSAGSGSRGALGGCSCPCCVQQVFAGWSEGPLSSSTETLMQGEETVPPGGKGEAGGTQVLPPVRRWCSGAGPHPEGQGEPCCGSRAEARRESSALRAGCQPVRCGGQGCAARNRAALVLLEPHKGCRAPGSWAGRSVHELGFGLLKHRAQGLFQTWAGGRALITFSSADAGARKHFCLSRRGGNNSVFSDVLIQPLVAKYAQI